MPQVRRLNVRNLHYGTGSSSSSLDFRLLVSLAVILSVSILCVGILMFLRRRRRSQQKGILPMHNGDHNSAKRSNHRRTASSMSIPGQFLNSQSQSSFVSREKMDLINNSSSPPPKVLPEIRIHFPEEMDDTGKRSSRVVVVRVGENGVGLEPIEESLPPYQKEDGRFESLDLDRMGGLTEKEPRPLVPPAA